MIHKKDWAGILQGMTELGLYELLARVIMLILAFVPFFAFWEIGRVLGPGKLTTMFFSKRSGAWRGPTAGSVILSYDAAPTARRRRRSEKPPKGCK